MTDQTPAQALMDLHVMLNEFWTKLTERGFSVSKPSIGVDVSSKKLFVAGEVSGNPTDWSGDFTLIIADSPEAASKMVDGSRTIEVSMEAPGIICHVYSHENL